MSVPDIEAACREVYERTQRFFARIETQLPETAKRGVSILWAPPRARPPVLFLGVQPGGAREESQADLPEANELVDGDARLQDELRKIYDSAFLEQCNGTNLIFLRSPKQDVYRDEVGSLRAQIEAFCLEQVEELVRILDPARIVVIGLGVLDRLAPNTVVLRNEQRVTLVTEGRIFQKPATAVVHLTGARGVTAEDRARIRDYLRSLPVVPGETGVLAT